MNNIKNNYLSKKKYIKEIRKTKKQFVTLLIIIIPLLAIFTFQNMKTIVTIYNQKKEIETLQKDIKIKKEKSEKLTEETLLVLNNKEYKIKKLRELYPIRKKDEVCIRIKF